MEISINFILPQLRPRCPPCWTPHQSYGVINIHSSQSPNENVRMCSAQITCQKKSHESTSQVNSLALRPFRKTCLGKNPLGSTCWRSIEKNLYNLLKKSLKLQYFSKPLYHGWFCERSSFPLLSAIQSTNHWKKLVDKTQHWNIFNGSSDRICWEGEIAQSNRLIVSQANKGKDRDEFSVTSRQPLVASK